MTHRREFFQTALTAATASVTQSRSRAAAQKLGMPGPYPGRVVAVEHPGCILEGAYQPAAVRQMMLKGMTELTGAPGWSDAWKALFEKGDVVGIKVSPVGGRNLCSDASVLHSILDGLKEAGVPTRDILVCWGPDEDIGDYANRHLFASDDELVSVLHLILDGLKEAGLPTRDIIVFNRYRQEFIQAGIDKWLPDGIRWDAASEKYDNVQLDMGGYDPDHYMEMALIKPGENQTDVHYRRSYVARIVTRQVNKIINLPVLKHHQSAGVTIALKNLSHGCVNNVCRSHLTPTLNACGAFIPSVVNLPVFREKVVLHIVDGVKASYHGGPGARPKYVWEHKTMYFGTDPVALDKTGWKAIDAKRLQAGMAPIALAKPDKESTFLNCQVEHIEIAGMLLLGKFKDEEIDVRRFKLT